MRAFQWDEEREKGRKKKDKNSNEKDKEESERSKEKPTNEIPLRTLLFLIGVLYIKTKLWSSFLGKKKN